MTDYRADVWEDGEWHGASLSSDALSDLLVQGVARLKEEQSEPPLELLHLLESRVGDANVFGPSAISPKVLERVNDTVFRSNLRQTIVEGHPLSWIEGRDHLSAKAETLLSGCTVRSANLFEQFRAIALRRALNASGVVQARRALSAEEQRTNGLVRKPIGMAWLIGDATKYVHVGSDWRRFHERLEAIEDGCSATISEAIANGSILCSEDAQKGDRLIHPEQVGSFKEHPRKAGMHYLFARDLPKNWFHEASKLPVRRKAAQDWIERAGAELSSKGKRASKEQLLTVAMEKFDLTEHAANKLWPKVDFPGKTQSGAIPVGKRVSSDEIREIE